MKHRLRRMGMVAACCGVTVAGVLGASAQDRGFYVKADVGGNVTPDLQLREFFGAPIAPDSKVRLDPGIRAGVSGGYDFCKWFAAEAEVGFYGNRIDGISGATRVHDASYANVPFLLNLKLQLPNRSPITPYIGGGVGGSESLISADHIDYPDGTGSIIHSHGDMSDTVFAYQGFAGLRWAINDHMGLSVEYHYFHADAARWEADTFGTLTDAMSFGPAHTHAASLTFNINF